MNRTARQIIGTIAFVIFLLALAIGGCRYLSSSSKTNPPDEAKATPSAEKKADASNAELLEQIQELKKELATKKKEPAPMDVTVIFKKIKDAVENHSEEERKPPTAKAVSESEEAKEKRLQLQDRIGYFLATKREAEFLLVNMNGIIRSSTTQSPTIRAERRASIRTLEERIQKARDGLVKAQTELADILSAQNRAMSPTE